jgi:hypothetical protein
MQNFSSMTRFVYKFIMVNLSKYMREIIFQFAKNSIFLTKDKTHALHSLYPTIHNTIPTVKFERIFHIAFFRLDSLANLKAMCVK